MPTDDVLAGDIPAVEIDPAVDPIVVVKPGGGVRLASIDEVKEAAVAEPILAPLDYDECAKTLIYLLRAARELAEHLEKAATVMQQLRRLEAHKPGRK